jgi:hypothetical protein
MIAEYRVEDSFRNLHQRHAAIQDISRFRYYFGCRLKILVVADGFLYFNDENFGLSELVSTLRGASTWRYPVTVDLAHRGNPGTERLNGAAPNFVFEASVLRRYHQVWILASEDRFDAPIGNDERQALRGFMDDGGGVFATGDHADLGVSVGGYIPRVRSMRRWFWPSPGPQGEPVAPDGSSASRHDTNREGHDAGFSFNDQSDDVPQAITPHYFGGFVQSVHPVLCTPAGPIRVLPDHPHEGECVIPSSLGGTYTIGRDTFREYPDGPGGTPLSPVVAATSTMIPGAEVPELGKPPVPGGTFGAIGAWDGHRAGHYGRIVVDATWHHFININLIGDRGLGTPNPGVPKSMGFLHTTAGQAHYERIQAYFTNIANWLTPRSLRNCWLHRDIWWVTQQGRFRENLRREDPVFTGHVALQVLRWLGPCDRFTFIADLFLERAMPRSLRALVDPFVEPSLETERLLAGMSRNDANVLAADAAAAFLGAAALEFLEADLSAERLREDAGEERAELPPLADAAARSIERGQRVICERLEQQIDTRQDLLKALH